MKMIINYIKSSAQELKKVKWPTKEVTWQYSAIVLAALVISTTLFGLVDFGLKEALNFLFLRG